MGQYILLGAIKAPISLLISHLMLLKSKSLDSASKMDLLWPNSGMRVYIVFS